MNITHKTLRAATFVLLAAGCSPTWYGPRTAAPSSSEEGVELAALRERCAGRDAHACDGYGVAVLRDLPPSPERFERAAWALRRACEANVPGSCTHLANALMTAPRPQRDPSQAKTIYEGACARGEADACAELGRGVEQGDFGERDPARATTLYQRACEAGNGMGCALLGDMFFRGADVPRDRTRGLGLYERGCRAGEERACLAAAEARCNLGGAADCTRARELQARACEARDGASCFLMTFHHLDGVSSPRDFTRAMYYADRACSLGVARGCEHVAWATALGEGVTADPARGAALLTGLCERGDDPLTQACSHLGLLYHLGRGVRADTARAASLWERACERGDGNGCSLLAMSYDEGLHAARDAARAFALYRRGCESSEIHSRLACAQLGYAYATGRGVAPSAERAVVAYERACEASEAVACQNLAEHVLAGDGVALDAERARALLDRSCAAGGAKACVLADLARAVPVSLAGAAVATEAEARCARGDGVGCVTLAFAHAMGRGVTPDAGRSTEALRRACRAGVSVACSAADAMARVAATPTSGELEIPLGR